MRNSFQYPITSRATDIFYKSPPAPQTIYFNEPQTYTAECPNSEESYTAIIPAGSYRSVISQEDADAKALQAAVQQADRGIFCGVLECSSRSTTATMFGYSEIQEPSSPPKKYLRLDSVGQMISVGYVTGDCSSSGNPGLVESVSGYCYYDRVTGDLINNTHRLRVEDGVTTYDGPWTCGIDSGICGIAFVGTKTTGTRTGNGDCCPVFGGSTKYVGESVQTLSDEYTEGDAVEAAFDGDTGWSDWVQPGVDMCCVGYRELRGAGEFSFVEKQVRFRISSTGRTPGTTYSAPVDIYRKLSGTSDPYVKVLTLVMQGVADEFGNVEVVGLTPNVAGYDSYPSLRGSEAGTC